MGQPGTRFEHRLALLLISLLLHACGGGAVPTTGTPTSTSPTPDSPVTTTAGVSTTTAPVDPLPGDPWTGDPWTWGLDSVDLGRGVVLGPCEGDADLIACFTRGQTHLGSAELLILPVDSFDTLDVVDDPMQSLELIASDYIATFSEDRQSTCPELDFEGLAPTVLTISGMPGLRFGFKESIGPNPVELNVIYGVRAGDNVEIFGFPAIDEGACLSNEGELTDPGLLDSLVPGLDAVMAVVESG